MRTLEMIWLQFLKFIWWACSQGTFGKRVSLQIMNYPSFHPSKAGLKRSLVMEEMDLHFLIDKINYPTPNLISLGLEASPIRPLLIKPWINWKLMFHNSILSLLSPVSLSLSLSLQSWIWVWNSALSFVLFCFLTLHFMGVSSSQTIQRVEVISLAR